MDVPSQLVKLCNIFKSIRRYTVSPIPLIPQEESNSFPFTRHPQPFSSDSALSGLRNIAITLPVTHAWLGLPLLKVSSTLKQYGSHPHHFLGETWQFRDRPARDPDSYDEDELCHAFTGLGKRNGAGVIVRREPWVVDGWEVTEEFVRNWGWVVQDCSDLFRSTNMWRARRGERPLINHDGAGAENMVSETSFTETESRIFQVTSSRH